MGRDGSIALKHKRDLVVHIERAGTRTALPIGHLNALAMVVLIHEGEVRGRAADSEILARVLLHRHHVGSALPTVVADDGRSTYRSYKIEEW